MYFQFMNAHLYFLKDNSSFLLVYCGFSLCFLFVLLLIFGFGNQIFKYALNEHITENIKVILKIMSIAMILFHRLFEVPFMTFLLEGYDCDEAVMNQEFKISFISCDEFEHHILVAASTILIPLFYCYLLAQNYLYTSYRFTSPLPWAGYENTTNIFRTVLKLIIVIGFVFGTNLPLHIYAFFPLAASFVSIIIISKRLLSDIYFREAI